LHIPLPFQKANTWAIGAPDDIGGPRNSFEVRKLPFFYQLFYITKFYATFPGKNFLELYLRLGGGEGGG
jgi:hypothetical protein